MTLSTTYLEVEVVRAGLLMLPFLVFGFIIMVFCSTLTVLLSAIYMQQASVHKVVNLTNYKYFISLNILVKKEHKKN